MNTRRNLIQMWLLCAAMLPAAAQTSFNLYFITNNGAITITGCKPAVENLIIPNTINGFAVTKIGNGAFSGFTSMTNAAIPDSVTDIGDDAFYYCLKLTSVTIGNSVTSIGNWAFNDCVKLTSVTIPDSVTRIGTNAFGCCSNLVNVMIGNGVTNIGDEAFHSCVSLTGVTIPNGVTRIGVDVFIGCSGLASVTIPNSVASIGDEAFRGCSRLTSMTISKSVTSIGGGAFLECSSLTSIMVDTNNPSFSSVGGVLFNKSRTVLIVCPGGLGGSYTIPDGVTSIGDGAFGECYRLTGVTIPTSVTSIGVGAFEGCYWLASITIPTSVTSIGDLAFSRCAYGLTSVTIPGSVTSIGNYTFETCFNLHTAYFLGSAPRGGIGAFSGESGTVYYLPGTLGWTNHFGGWPTALWYQPNPMILGSGYGLRATTNGFGFTISWATNLSVIVQACTNLANPVWLPVATNTLTSGTNHFCDPNWTNYPSRFYRIRSP